MIKRTIKKSVAQAKLSRITTSLSKSIIILRYHSVKANAKESSYYMGDIAVNSRIFEDHMRILADNYTPVDLNDIHDFLSGQRSIPRQAVAVSFDDGFRDNLTIAAPIMEKYGVKGTIYISTASVENGTPLWFLRLRGAFSKTTVPFWNDFTTGESFNLNDKIQRRKAFLRGSALCSKGEVESHESFLEKLERDLGVKAIGGDGAASLRPDEIAELDRRGHVIGAHTVDHYNVAYLDSDRLSSQLFESKKYLERILTKPVVHFSYPRPFYEEHHNVITKSALIKHDYKTAVTCDIGKTYYSTDAFLLKRIIPVFHVDEFKFQLEKTFLLG